LAGVLQDIRSRWPLDDQLSLTSGLPGESRRRNAAARRKRPEKPSDLREVTRHRRAFEDHAGEPARDVLFISPCETTAFVVTIQANLEGPRT
jgi:hypothetical protein